MFHTAEKVCLLLVGSIKATSLASEMAQHAGMLATKIDGLNSVPSVHRK